MSSRPLPVRVGPSELTRVPYSRLVGIADRDQAAPTVMAKRWSELPPPAVFGSVEHHAVEGLVLRTNPRITGRSILAEWPGL